MPFGSDSTALSEFKKGFSKVFAVAIAIVAGLAALIMMGTVGRIIADSRRKTAVFRALGAKRSDIAQIYVTYTLAVAVLIAAVSTLGGLAIAHLVEIHFGSDLTIYALVAFNIQNLSQHFSLIGFRPTDMLYAWLLIIAAAFIAAAVPLLANLRRNPINDMRDE